MLPNLHLLQILSNWGEERRGGAWGGRKGQLLDGESEENDTAVFRTAGYSQHTEVVLLLSSINLLYSPAAEVIHKKHKILAAAYWTEFNLYTQIMSY